MNNQALFTIQIIFVLFFIWWLWSRRGRLPQPTVLNLEKDLQIQKEIKNYENYDNNVKLSQQVYQKKLSSAYLLESIEPINVVESAKPLNIMFNWNGHSWDAYEVLGVAAGSSLEVVKIKYEELLVQSDEGQKLFLYEAYNSIVCKTSSLKSKK